MEPKTKRFLSEDYTFCMRWKQAGGKVYADLKVRLGHWGTMSLIGNAYEAIVDLKTRTIRRDYME